MSVWLSSVTFVLKPYAGLTIHLTGTLVRSSDTLCYTGVPDSPRESEIWRSNSGVKTCHFKLLLQPSEYKQAIPLFLKLFWFWLLLLSFSLLLLFVKYVSYGGGGCRRTVIEIQLTASRRRWRHVRYDDVTWLRDTGSRRRVRRVMIMMMMMCDTEWRVVVVVVDQTSEAEMIGLGTRQRGRVTTSGSHVTSSKQVCIGGSAGCCYAGRAVVVH